MPLYGGIVQSKSCFFSPSSASENSVTRACLQSSSDAAFRKSRIEEWRGSMVSLQTRPSSSLTALPASSWIQAGSGHGRDSRSPLIVEGIGITFSQSLLKHCIVTVNVFVEENPSSIIDGYCQIEDIYRYRRLEVSGYGFRAVHCFHYTVARPFSIGIQHKLGEAY